MSDLYNDTTAVLSSPVPGPPSGNLTWFSGFTRTSDNSSIANTAFEFNITTSSSLNGRQDLNWTVTIPSPTGACLGCNTTIVRFTVIRSFISPKTNATYAFFFANGTKAFGPNSLDNRTTNIPTRLEGIVCPQTTQVCFDATNMVGLNLTVRFGFGWNVTGPGQKILNVQVGRLTVFATSPSFVNSDTHMMNLASGSSEVEHVSNVTISYNRTISGASHNWSAAIVTFYRPAAYLLGMILEGATPVFSPTAPPPYAFETGRCENTGCRSVYPSSIVSLNMTTEQANGLVLTVKANTTNTVSLVQTILGPSKVKSWQPGDDFTVLVRNATTVVTAGNLTLSFTDPNQNVNTTIRTDIVRNNKSNGTFTFRAPSTPLGMWKVTVDFTSHYDLGLGNNTFAVQSLNPVQNFSYSGNNTRLTATGKIQLNSATLTPSPGTDIAVFAVDTLSPPNPFTVTNSSTSGLLVSNITLVNGVFTAGQSLVMYFTIANPTSQTLTAANVTIEHEGSTVKFSTDTAFGDPPFLTIPNVYRADITLQSDRIQVVVTSQTTRNKITLSLPPVPINHQRLGLFKIVVESRPGGNPVFNSTESPVYAFVLTNNLVGNLLDEAKTVTDASGDFSVTLNRNRILAAKRLTFIVLGKDSIGTLMSNQNPAAATDFTQIQSSLDPLKEVTLRQNVTTTLHLKSTSTRITMILTVNLDLGSKTVDTKSATISPGGTADLAFSFEAPSEAGLYTITFSSPQYRAPLYTQTLQVSLVPSNLQIIIPALIGLVAALAIMGFYLVKKRPGTELEKAEKPRPAGGKPSRPQPGTQSSKCLTRS